MKRSRKVWGKAAVTLAVGVFLLAAVWEISWAAGFRTPGELDTDFGSSDYGTAVAIQPDGKIVVAGYAYSGDANFAAARYLSNGSLDPGGIFGSGGKVTTDFAGGNGARFTWGGAVLVG